MEPTTPEPLADVLVKVPIWPTVDGIRMNRQDSEYSDKTRASSSSSRRKSLPTSQPIPRKPRTPTATVSRYDTTRSCPQTRRSSRSTSHTAPSRSSRSSSLRRPGLPSRHTVPVQTQFFQFPMLVEPLGLDLLVSQSTPEPETREESTPPPLPPATVHYWTSDSTRRLEYAAIDAASRGVRGFVVKLIPDCILPRTARRTRFHSQDADDADAGSVRRYRLVLAEDDIHGEGTEKETTSPSDRKSWWRMRLRN